MAIVGIDMMVVYIVAPVELLVGCLMLQTGIVEGAGGVRDGGRDQV